MARRQFRRRGPRDPLNAVGAPFQPGRSYGGRTASVSRDHEPPRARPLRAHGEVREVEVVAVARARDAAVPVLRGRDRLEPAVACRQADRRARRFAVDQHGPRIAVAGALVDDEGVCLARSDRAQRHVRRGRVAGPLELVVEDVEAARVVGDPGLQPLVGAARPEARAADADPGGDMADADHGRPGERQAGRDTVGGSRALDAVVGIARPARLRQVLRVRRGSARHDGKHGGAQGSEPGECEEARSRIVCEWPGSCRRRSSLSCSRRPLRPSR